MGFQAVKHVHSKAARQGEAGTEHTWSSFPTQHTIWEIVQVHEIWNGFRKQSMIKFLTLKLKFSLGLPFKTVQVELEGWSKLKALSAYAED